MQIFLRFKLRIQLLFVTFQKMYYSEEWIIIGGHQNFKNFNESFHPVLCIDPINRYHLSVLYVYRLVIIHLLYLLPLLGEHLYWELYSLLVKQCFSRIAFIYTTEPGKSNQKR